jgi:site-specific DNA recombinase
MTMRVATYTRISTDEEHQPYSLEAQETRLDAYIRSQEGWQLSRRYTDQMSGSTLDRPALARALADARLHRYDLLLVYRVDRLSRSVRGLAQLLEELDQVGVHFRSATEPFDTGTAAGRMMVQMLGVFAEFERATLVDRVIAGMERKAARGEWLGGHAPYGYRIDSETSLLMPCAPEAPVVPLIFDRYLKKRQGARAIAAWLNEHGYRSRPGRVWGHVGVLKVLRNAAYIGQINFRGVSHAAPHPPLVDPATFDATQRLLDLRGEGCTNRRSNTTDYLLSGLVTCARCGSRYVGTAAHGRTSRYRYYTCFSRNRYGRHGCQSDRLPADKLDKAVLDALLMTYADSELVDDAIAEARRAAEAEAPQVRSRLQGIAAEIRQAEEALERYYSAFESGSLSERRFAGRIDVLEERLAALRRRQSELADAASDDRPIPSEEGLRDTQAAVREAIVRGTPGQRKALLQALVAEIRVESRDAIYPTFRLLAGTVRVMDQMVGGPGLEPGCLAAHAPQTCASTSSASRPLRCTRHLPARGFEPLTSWSEAMRSIH